MAQFALRLPLVNTGALIATLVVNSLANALPLNGQTTGQIADRVDVYFIPAGYAFSIWGLIYASQVAFVVYQWLPAHRSSPAVSRLGLVYAWCCAANIAWLFCWHYEFFALALVAMLAMLSGLITAYLRLDIGRAEVSRGDRWFVHAPISLYLGWISVATIANSSQLLDYLQWQRWGFSEEVWMSVMLAVTAVLAVTMAWRRRDAIYLAVLVWALVGIALKHGAVAIVANGAWAVAGLVTLLALGSLFRPAVTVKA